MMFTPKPSLAEVEPLSSDISPRAVSRVAYLPGRERDTTVDRKGLKI